MAGQYFKVDYVDGAVAHERLVLWPVSPSRWVVRSPDADKWIEHARAGGASPLYRFRKKLYDPELKGAMIRGLGQAVAAAGGLELMPVVEQVKNEDSGDVRHLVFFGATLSSLLQQAMVRRAGVGAAAGAAAGTLVAPPAPGPDPGWAAAAVGDSLVDEVWVACVAGPTVEKGSEVRLVLGRDVVFGGRRAMIRDGEAWSA